MTRRYRFACWAFSMAAAACGSSDSNGNDPNAGGQTGEENVGCLPVETTNLAWSERSSLGFSADELLNSLGADRQTRLTWDDGSSTSLTMTLARASGAPTLQQREWTDDGSGRELAAGSECNDVVTVPATLTFTTNDGAFAEAWSLTLLADGSSSASGYMQLDLNELQGDFEVTMVDPADYEAVTAFVNLSFDGARWTGTISGQASRTEGQTSSAQNFSIASF